MCTKQVQRLVWIMCWKKNQPAELRLHVPSHIVHCKYRLYWNGFWECWIPSQRWNMFLSKSIARSLAGARGSFILQGASPPYFLPPNLIVKMEVLVAGQTRNSCGNVTGVRDVSDLHKLQSHSQRILPSNLIIATVLRQQHWQSIQHPQHTEAQTQL